MPRLQSINQLHVKIIGVDLVKPDAGSPVVPDLDFNQPRRGIGYFDQRRRH